MNVGDLTEDHYGQRIRLLLSVQQREWVEGTLDHVELIRHEVGRAMQGNTPFYRDRPRVWIDGQDYDVQDGSPVEHLD